MNWQEFGKTEKKKRKMMEEKLINKTTGTCVLIFLIILVVHSFEAIILRMDETFFAENFINKLFGIAVLFVVLKLLGWKWEDIGFKRNGIAKGIAIGFALAAVSFLAAYTAEAIILNSLGQHVSMGFFTTGFSLTGNTVEQSGIGFILMCIGFNIINVIMEEGTFRGLFFHILSTDHSVKKAVLIQALLFGIWHIVTPLHNWIDGELNAAGFLGLSAGYIVLAWMMGIKWGLMLRMTGSLYAGMADHFFNNCIATNLLHVVTESGIDEMMIVRVLIAQILSFIIVGAAWKKQRLISKE